MSHKFFISGILAILAATAVSGQGPQPQRTDPRPELSTNVSARGADTFVESSGLGSVRCGCGPCPETAVAARIARMPLMKNLWDIPRLYNSLEVVRSEERRVGKECRSRW